MNIESKAENINASNRKVYEMLCDCRNFEQMATQKQVQNWHAEEDFCEFEVSGIAKITLRIQEKQPYSHITYTVGNDKQIPASCTFDISDGETSCDLSLTMNLEIPTFLAPMVKGPMQQFADTLTNAIRMAATKA